MKSLELLIFAKQNHKLMIFLVAKKVAKFQIVLFIGIHIDCYN